MPATPGTTTIEIPRVLRERLHARKSHPRQPYHEVIAAALDTLESAAPATAGHLDPLVARHRTRLLQAAQDNGITRLWLFGARARRDAAPDGEADLLYEARPGKTLWDVCPFLLAAEEVLGVRVRIVERGALHGAFRDQVALEAVPL